MVGVVAGTVGLAGPLAEGIREDTLLDTRILPGKRMRAATFTG